MTFVRRMILALLLLVPLATLFHRNDLRQWDVQHSAMAGPDEFSYLLMADHFSHGGGLSLKGTLGIDTFYPPGYPLIIEAWCRIFSGGKVRALAAHVLNTSLLSADILLAYLLARALLLRLAPGPYARWLALLVAAIFAVNWHVLETSLSIMSEPAFMLALFVWLGCALRWKHWDESVGKTCVMALLATLAWSIRGAGITCVAATILYPAIRLALDRRAPAASTPTALSRRLLALAMALAIIAAYQIGLTVASREKSLLAGNDSRNSYPQQLMNGLTDRGALNLTTPGDWPNIAEGFVRQVASHLDDLANSFVPWQRENPDMHFRDIAGKAVLLLALLGWLNRVWQNAGRYKAAPLHNSSANTVFIHLFLFFYIGLYLIWPFNFARFWSPILPLMLVFAADALSQFIRAHRRGIALAAALLSLLFTLSAEEDIVQLHNYARRLNYVSDSLATTAQLIAQRSPYPQRTFVVALDGDYDLALAWHFAELADDPAQRIIPRTPGAQFAGENKLPTAGDDLLMQSLAEAAALPGEGGRVYLSTYFASPDGVWTLANLERKLGPEDWAKVRVAKVYQKEIIITVWELDPAPDFHAPATASATSP